MPDDLFLEYPDVRKAYLMAWILTGSEESASRIFPEALREAAAHPDSNDPVCRNRVLMAAVRRRALRAPAACTLTPQLTELHRRAEPGRSLVILEDLDILSGDGAAALLGADPAAARNALILTRERFPEPDLLSREFAALVPDPAPECREAILRFHGGGCQRKVRNPTLAAVAASFLLLIGIVVWQFTGRMGAFPGEVLKIADQARKAGPENFSPVEIKARTLPDWFALQGFDGLFIPDTFAGLDVVGARTFRHEGENVAQMAVQDTDRNLYLIAFPTKPFNIRGLPTETWGIAASGRFAVAATERNGVCLLVTFRGTPNDMKTFLEGLGRKQL